MRRIIFLFFLFFACIETALSQVPDFLPPISDGQLYLSGTFGELRSNHFHSGIDIKTGGAIGKKVVAVYDGYISRISVSPYGYGKAIYITHPNGYTSVYGHLDHFRKDIADYVVKYQYEKESFNANIFLNAETFPVKRGDIIAWSGNSGGSAGPHLHFEIRETKSERPIDPMQFKLPVKDWTKPKIIALRIYPYGNNSFVNGKNEVCKKTTNGWGENYHLLDNDTLYLQGPIYFGINAYDAMNDISNKNGIYSLLCLVDNDTLYHIENDGFLFSESKYINSVIDYKYFINSKARYYRTLHEPNNKLQMVKNVDNNGIVNLSDDSIHKVKFVVKDSYLNTSALSFNIVRDTNYYEPTDTISKDYFFRYFTTNKLSFDDFKLQMEAYTLFNDLAFDFNIVDAQAKDLSPTYVVGDNTLVTFKTFKISIKINDTLDDNIKPHLYIAAQNQKNWNYVGGTISDGWISLWTRNFGSYKLLCDTIPPEIKCASLKPKIANNVSGKQEIKVIIKDKTSGIKSYTPTLNGEWILMDYDAKNSLLVYKFDKRIKKGNNIFKIVVTDNCNNTYEFERVLNY
ncbi:MAG: M23 family metallopeptidase [Bacteroidales bacterium]|jgi:hypothetical protein|nr:M23 family metallopeptidase [Bacteroidales bacterium]MDD2204765.1 M23 family metallopeptidase [Bacteroidales bacterium]MDD3151631.1 M23 family metallopeptidase [Bacteroidales bacterium]MDD3914188.1 M23 family metallopeptidase [Bacteroidales bacterium]MDD4633723.1 M23 family metallopeptidase [Bacteroidales bacterium]